MDTDVRSGHGIWGSNDGRFHLSSDVTVFFWGHHGAALKNGTDIVDLVTEFNA